MAICINVIYIKFISKTKLKFLLDYINAVIPATVPCYGANAPINRRQRE